MAGPRSRATRLGARSSPIPAPQANIEHFADGLAFGEQTLCFECRHFELALESELARRLCRRFGWWNSPSAHRTACLPSEHGLCHLSGCRATQQRILRIFPASLL